MNALCSNNDCGTEVKVGETLCSRCKMVENAKNNTVNLQKQELARRVIAKRRLLPFVQRMMPDYKAGWVHKDICNRLEQFAQDVVDQKSPRLMIMMPPRSGKSQLASTFFPAWFIGNNPAKEIIACSYSASLSMSFSRAIRETLREKSYQNVFKACRLNKDSQSVENWLTTEHGGYLAAGVGGPITGRGAHCLIIDDPVKNFEEADSATQRDAVWNWWTTTAYTRLAPGGGVLVIQTRWHHDDLSGRILQQFEDAKSQNVELPEWAVVSYPAIAEADEEFRKQGEALHPERYDLKQLNAIKATVGARDWAALYQQKPTLDEGAYFREPFFRYWQMDPSEESADKRKPEELVVYATWDLALGKKESNDFTSSIVFGVDRNEDIYVLDLVHEKIDAMEIVEKMIDQFEQWRPTATGIERTHMQMAIGPFLNKRIRERKAYAMYVYEQLPGRRDKELRARSIQGRIQQGKVFFPRNAPWLHVMVTELLQFPAGVHDDIVDCLSYAGLLLEELVVPRTFIKPKKASWKDNLDRYIKGGDSVKSHMVA
jgi:predicted phage terminase large subunit-like protein